jgi:ankyrin repeat protein
MMSHASLSAEEKNAQMFRERETLRQLLQAAQQQDFAALRSVVKEYIRSMRPADDHPITIVDVLSQFRDARKRTALHFACQCTEKKIKEGQNEMDEKDIVEQILEWILDQQPRPNPDSIQKLLRLKDSEGLTPLMMAAQSCQSVARVRALLHADARTSSSGKSTLGLARSKAGATALHYAAGSATDATVIECLYDAGPVALQTFSTTGGTPLHWACAAASTELPVEDASQEEKILQQRQAVIQALLDLGADINACQPPGGVPTPLVFLMASANDRLAYFFLSHHPQHNLQPSLDFVLTPVNATPLHMAADLNLVIALQWLIRYYQEQENQDIFERLEFEEYTALDMAAKEKHVECVQLLLNATATKENKSLYTLADAQAYIANWQPRAPRQISAPSEPMAPPPPPDSYDTMVKDMDTVEQKAKQDASQILLQRDSMVVQQDDKDATEASAQQAALEHKSRGNEYFSEQNWVRAVDAYTQAIALQPHEATLYSNRSAAYAAWLGHEDDALYDAVMAQTLQPTWPKAFYRVSVARLAQQRYEDAAVAAWEGVQLDPENAELKELLQRCVQKGRREHQKKKEPK